ncbi:MAG: response regulator [Acidobacteria bacterium]|nr:response regulator [Acidobacteriota bacterium]
MTPPAHPLCVLVVEDETLIRWSIAETLTGKGHRVVEAVTACTAVRALHDSTAPIDVVLLDYRLPDSNDLGLLASIRRLSPASAVVMMTACGTPEVTKGAMELGACRVLNKPFDMHGLEAVVLAAYGSHVSAGAHR